MRNMRSPQSYIGILIALCVASLLCATGAMSQTLTNGNFEGGSTGGVGTGWTSYLGAGSTGVFVIQTALPPEGLQYQQIQITVANNYGGVRQAVTGCTAGASYTIAGKFRTNSATATSSVRVDPAGGTTMPSTVMASTTSTAFTSFSFNVRATSTSMTIFLDTAVTTATKAGAFDAITVTGCTAPAAPTGTAANPTTVCSGASVTLSATPPSGCAVDWYAGSCVGASVGSGASLIVSPLTTTTYYPHARNTTTGCGSLSCGPPVTVTATTAPSAPTSPAANPASVSPGGSSTLTATVPGGVTVNWYTGSCGGTLVGSGTSLVVTPDSTTTYYPRAVATSGGCPSASCGTAVTVTVSIPPAAIRFVKFHAGGAHDGLTWATAMNKISEAVGASVAGNQIWVASGTYVENIVLRSGIALYGGFAGTETLLTQRNWATNTSVIDGNWAGSTIEVIRDAITTTRIDGFTITNGRAVVGGGIYCNQNAVPVIANNTIKGNAADFDGGGIFCNTGSAPVIANNKIMDNGAIASGGGVRSMTGAVKLTNNLMIGNTARMGGAICSGDTLTTMTASHEYIINNTIVSNGAAYGGAIYCYSVSSASISNNIIAFNARGIFSLAGTGAPALNNNCLYGNDGGNYAGVSSATDIYTNPQLASATYGNLHIQSASPCKNTGNNAEVIAGWNDIDNQPRIVGTVDIGADESDGTTHSVTPMIVRVATTGSDTNNGSSWALAKKTIQAAILSLSKDGGEVWVKAGTYNERVALNDYVYVYGGFAGTETLRTQRNWTTNVTIIDPQLTGSAVTASSLGYRISAIDGFKLQNGSSLNGAGVFCRNASPLVINNTITACAASRNGGGVYLANSSALVKVNSIINNSAMGNGGGVFCIESTSEVSRNNIEDNWACIAGCGVFASTNDMSKLINNKIIKNHQNPTMGGAWGAGVAVDSYSDPIMICNTIADNGAGNGAIYAGVYGYMEMYSNIFAFNSSGIVKDSNATIVQTALWTADPLFVNRAGGDYRLQSGSGCINAADVASAPVDDYLGNTRTDPDIGCYEYGVGGPEAPVAPTSASATPSTISSGANVTLHANGGSGTTLRWLTGSCTGVSVGTGNDLVVSPTSSTTYYARWETSLGNSSCVTTTVTVLPTVTSITPTSGPNTGPTTITNLVGTGFLTGATVKLKRTGKTDITASGVSVVSATKITCAFDLTNKAVGVWDVFVLNTDAQSGTLARGFGIRVSNTAPLMGTGIYGLLYEQVMVLAAPTRQVCVWGKAEVIDSSSLWIADASGNKIKVFLPGYASLGIVTGNNVAATGGVDLTVSPVILISSDLRKY